MRDYRKKVMRQLEKPSQGSRKIKIVPTMLAATLLPVTAAAAQESDATSKDVDLAVAWIDGAVHWTVRVIEIVGIAAIVIGAVVAAGTYLYRTASRKPQQAEYQAFRAALGRSILLGLEFLVAADIINTVAIDPTLESVAVLAAIVLVRTFLSFALEVEIDGTWPWNKDGR